ncbi:hypothetical protein SNE40_013096 [Patella caerulea]|uniref:Uncharacterized protein n=1 Tax=Patella caerulea TaxID=87958 RepID=A0AAN8JLM7_PATCE
MKLHISPFSAPTRSSQGEIRVIMYSVKQYFVLAFSSIVLLVHSSKCNEFSSLISGPDGVKRDPGWGKRNRMLASEKDVSQYKRVPGWGRRSMSALLDADKWIGDIFKDFSRRVPDWDRRSIGVYTDDKRTPGWGKRGQTWHKRAPGWGKRTPGWGKRSPGWGKRSDCSSLENQFNYYVSKAAQVGKVIFTQIDYNCILNLLLEYHSVQNSINNYYKCSL